jgi:hypothetical protein
MDSSDVWRVALAVFLILTGLGLTFVFVRLAGTLGRVNTMLDGLVQELIPMLGKVSASIDHVNDELTKVGRITDTAVEATEKADATVRTVSAAVVRPVKAVAGFSAGVAHGVASFRARREQRGGIV